MNVGDGSNDIVSVHSGNASANTLVVDEAFGKVTVVNWHKVSPDDVDNRDEMGEHALDFSAYLDDQIDDSDNDNADTAVEVAASANMVAGASALGTAVSAGLDNDNTARANSVNSIRFEQNLADGETFEGLNDSNLLTALNAADADDEYGNLNDALLNPGTTADLVGDTQNHIVMVENDLNEGEYKVFHLTSESDADDFSTADELGTLDFGASINFNVAGSTTFENYVEAVSQAKDDGATDFTYDVVDSGGNVVATADADVNDGTGDAGGAGGGGAGAGGAGGSGAGGGGAGGASETVEVTGAGDDDAANADVTFDFDDGAYEFDIANFDTGDTLDFGDVAGVDQAIFNVLADANLGDGEKQLSAANGDTGDTVEVTLTGLTAAQDNAVFNQSSFENTFGADSLVF
ncbi:type I secretion target repeat protein [Spiribacter salinus M19-40]|uniref:Type I secretion target repeat protein n=1 Tax=Spiribacter salinus M19-40 TaxID=1260251 RepID=R4V9H8_9GAMM|nr:hypothetical protein [Spiribacter salinus]AGM41615.1 type I secretion target repeat protein [Spiribacter salinus M19-40]